MKRSNTFPWRSNGFVATCPNSTKRSEPISLLPARSRNLKRRQLAEKKEPPKAAGPARGPKSAIRKEAAMTDNLVPSQPFSAEIMEKIEEAAVSAAREILSGRRIIDVEGAYGLGLTTVEVGNDDLCREPGPGEASAVLSRALSLPM